MDNNEFKKQLTAAIGAHGLWKIKLETAASTGQLGTTPDKISADNNCKFGKWLYGLQADPAIGGTPIFNDIKSMHADFHKVAGCIAAKIDSGDVNGAKSDLEGVEFEAIGAKLVTALTKWKATA